eukprot:2913452-Prymnesium_polylepis.1
MQQPRRRSGPSCSSTASASSSFDNGAAAPTFTVLAPVLTFLLSSTDFTDINVLIARAEAVVSPAAAYFRTRRGGQD